MRNGKFRRYDATWRDVEVAAFPLSSCIHSSLYLSTAVYIRIMGGESPCYTKLWTTQ